jgi:hypothetical protein
MIWDQSNSKIGRKNFLNNQQEVKLEVDILSRKIKAVIDALPSNRVEVADIRDLFGQEGLMLLTVFLTIPFMIPISIPGASTVFGAVILLIGFSRLSGRSLWLPKRIEQRKIPTDKLRACLNQGLIFFHRLEGVARPYRLKWFISGGIANTLNNFSLITGAILLMAPFGLIPFSNTLPALALLFLAIGFLQRDGVCILVGHLANFVTITYFAFLIAGGSALIHGIFKYLSRLYA